MKNKVTIQQRWINIQLWLFNLLLNSLKPKFINGEVNFETRVMPERDLFAFTRMISRRKSFVREVRQVAVKKGQRKYTLLFVTTLDGTTRHNLGRHFDLTKGYLGGKPIIEIDGRDMYGWQKTQQDKRLAA